MGMFASKKMEEDRMNSLDPMTAWSVHSYALLANLDAIVKRLSKWVEDDEKKVLREMLNNAVPSRLKCGSVSSTSVEILWGDANWKASKGFHYELHARSLPRDMEDVIGGMDMRGYKPVYSGTDRGCSVSKLLPAAP